jgi:hypothetical protein
MLEPTAEPPTAFLVVQDAKESEVGRRHCRLQHQRPTSDEVGMCKRQRSAIAAGTVGFNINDHL